MMTRLAPRFQNAMHFAERDQRLGEVLKRGPAEQEIEAVVLEGHAGGVPQPEVDLDVRLGRVAPRDVDERLADVETGDVVISQPGQLDGEVPRPGRNFQHAASGGNLPGDPPGERLELSE